MEYHYVGFIIMRYIGGWLHKWVKPAIYLDISSRFSFWTEYAVNQLDKKNWKGAIGGLNNINSALGEDYIVSINSQEFYKQVADRTNYKCNYCLKDNIYSKVKIFDLVCPIFEGVVTGEKTNQIWICSFCKKDCKLKDTIITMEETVQPFYRKVVPAPPFKQIGLNNRFRFEHEFKEWFYNFMEELQHQLARYRIEYIKQNGHDMSDSGYQHKGDGE